MDAEQVARLAAQENGMWGGGDGDGWSVPPAGPGAYQPLAGAGGADPSGSEPAGEPEPRITVLGVDALGTTLALRFRWPVDPARRELVLLLDFSGFAGDLDGAATWLLEYVAQRIHHDRSWFPHDLVPISEAVAVVRPVRQPGERLFGDGRPGH